MILKAYFLNSSSTISKSMIALIFACSCNIVISQSADSDQKDYWKITDRQSIVWDLTTEHRLPHNENIEMSGQKVSSIIYYKIDEDRNLKINRDIIFPQLRTFNKSNEPDWKKYRAYYRKTISDDISISIENNGKIIVPSMVDSVEIDGILSFYHTPVDGISISRTIYPSMTSGCLVEEWTITNVGSAVDTLTIGNCSMELSEQGYLGKYNFSVESDAREAIQLRPGQSYVCDVKYSASIQDDDIGVVESENMKQDRINFINEMKSSLTLKTPDAIINTLFYFSKIRAAESIFQSDMGLVHSPGGGNYYLGIWANDQVEYSGPFFPYLGYKNGNTAAKNTYRHFQKNIPEDESAIPYAFEMNGVYAMDHLDRGDAAMIAYGTSHYLLVSGDAQLATELWPLIEWSLEYCHNNRNDAGAVISESDEMEGRIETGTANLSTSSLYYGGLKYASRLAKAIGKTNLSDSYYNRMSEMKDVIEDYFGSNIYGIDTYRYFDGNESFRHWICLPLCMDITDRIEGTTSALLDSMWTDNGILVEKSRDTTAQVLFWDRATLYALRGILRTGASEVVMKRLQEYSQKRLLGDHVPYPVEAYPENNMKHLSAESALYCRIITEGLLGIEPMGLGVIQIHPSLPDDWDFLYLDNLKIADRNTNISLKRANDGLSLEVSCNGKIILDQVLGTGESVIIDLKG